MRTSPDSSKLGPEHYINRRAILQELSILEIALHDALGVKQLTIAYIAKL
jgi:hypothetical protein